MVWGLLPIDFEVSFEAHITGAVSGIILAVIYRDQGPEPEKSSLDEEEEPSDEEPSDEEPSEEDQPDH
jgi:hypothetical protein